MEDLMQVALELFRALSDEEKERIILQLSSPSLTE